MVLGEVREDGGGEADGIGAPKGERVRGDLHRTESLTPVEHRTEVGLQVDRLRGRASRRTA